MSGPKFGEIVRARCGATGRYMRDGMVLFVSAQDNDLGIDAADFDTEPWRESPLPSVEACMAANVGIVHGRTRTS